MKIAWKFCYVALIVAVLLCIDLGNRAVTAAVENRTVIAQHCIVIDAGHGGEDGGATSCSGKLESEYNLEIALKLNDLFHLLGWNTRMIRTADISVYTAGESIAQKKASDLKERVRIVNETDHTLLLSIHQNHFADSRYSGAQIFYSDHPQSRALAKLLQEAFVNSLNPGSKRVCKKSEGIYLMQHIENPGILIECGFLSNPAEEAQLRSAEYQKKICCVIAATVTGFLSNT